ncbi:MAG: hypothetical protein IPP83_00235 [Flavobacteriales bacterium]|nr:hypothetical protein [Flavobacteriales bacterium]
MSILRLAMSCGLLWPKRNNAIFYLALSPSRIGIDLLAVDDWLVADNALYMQHNTFNLYGVNLNGCRRTEVSCNAITSTDHNLINDRQAAIRNFKGSDPLISCNEMNWTTNGLLFNGETPGTDVRGNKMRKHRWGLHLGNTAVIGTQEVKGNLWYFPPVGSGLGALNQHQDADLYPFTYLPAIISGGNTEPPSWSPQLWFLVDLLGSNYECISDNEGDYCSQFYAERCTGCLTELDERVASGEIENNPYTAETRWALEGDLYKKLDDHPELRTAHPDLEDFYTELQGSAIAAFKGVDDAQIGLYDLDANVAEQLVLNREQADGLAVQIAAAIDALTEPNLSAAQRAAALADLNGYRSALSQLVAYNTSALHLASTSKVLSAESVKTINAAIGTSALIEANQKAVNETHLATIGKDVDEFTTAQAEALYEIANQCPMTGGNAVFKARAMYQLIDGSVEFDDVMLCLQEGFVIKSVLVHGAIAASVLPNPADDRATLVLEQPLEEPGTFMLYNAQGSMVMSRVVPKDARRLEFGTTELAPGLYHFTLRSTTGAVASGKLAINH